MNAAMPAKCVFGGIGVELIRRESLLASQQLELLGQHEDVQDALFCADRTIAFRDARQIGTDAKVDAPAVATALVTLDHWLTTPIYFAARGVRRGGSGIYPAGRRRATFGPVRRHRRTRV